MSKRRNVAKTIKEGRFQLVQRARNVPGKEQQLCKTGENEGQDVAPSNVKMMPWYTQLLCSIMYMRI